MAKLLSDDTIRRRDVRVKMEWAEIADLIARAAMAGCEIQGTPGVNGAKAVVELKQEERGSPSYRVDEWSAIIKVSIPVE